jgi:hypothetical protein
MDAGEIERIQIPSSPAQKFRLKMNVEDSFRGLIREDSLVTVDGVSLVSVGSAGK